MALQETHQEHSWFRTTDKIGQDKLIGLSGHFRQAQMLKSDQLSECPVADRYPSHLG